MPRRPCLAIAHRGAPREAPENTLASFAAALDAGADVIECDVQATADGELVVIHDDRLQRTTDGDVYVGDITLAQLRRLSAGAWFGPVFTGERVPTLAEVCAWSAGRVRLNVEVKVPAESFGPLAPRFLDILAANDLLGSVLVSSFSAAVLAQLRAASTAVSLAYIFVLAWPLPAAVAPLSLSALHPADQSVRAEAVTRAHEQGLAVNVWTVDEPARWAELAAWGVDGLVSNQPRALVRWLRGSPATRGLTKE